MKNIIILLMATTLLSGCLASYPKVKDTKNASFIKFERKMIDPVLGSITRYANVDNKQKCHEPYSDHKLLAVQNRGNPLVSDLNLEGLYVNSGDNFRILINTVAGGASCDVIVSLDAQAGQNYKILTEGNVYIGVNKCSAKIYKQASNGNAYEPIQFKEYIECNK